MRFRKRFGLLGWVNVFGACFYAFDWFVGRSSSTSAIILALRGFAIAAFSCAALLMILDSRSVYWELDSNGLHQCRFGSAKELTVAWDEVIVVRDVIPGLRLDGTVAVYYKFPGSKLGFKRIVVLPERRNELIAALRRFAPQATFTV
jgi:hypothetical protein